MKKKYMESKKLTANGQDFGVIWLQEWRQTTFLKKSNYLETIKENMLWNESIEIVDADTRAVFIGQEVRNFCRNERKTIRENIVGEEGR